MSTAVSEVTEVGSDDDARRPLMTSANIAWMNLGFFGVQFSFGLTQSAVNPIFLFLGAEAHSLPLLNIAGPITGLLIQPLIGAMSDKTWSPRGRQSRSRRSVTARYQTSGSVTRSGAPTVHCASRLVTRRGPTWRAARFRVMASSPPRGHREESGEGCLDHQPQGRCG